MSISATCFGETGTFTQTCSAQLKLEIRDPFHGNNFVIQDGDENRKKICLI